MSADLKGFDERVHGIADNLTVTAQTLNRAIADAGDTIPGEAAQAPLSWQGWTERQ